MLLRRPRPVEDGLLTLSDIPRPSPGAGELLIDVEACGVCRTDVHIAEGEVRATLPIVLGHQVAGRVAAFGANVTGFAVGDAVGIGWLGWTCGACEYCSRGSENLCERARFTGREIDGGFAEAVVADARFAFKLPGAMTAHAAAPLLCAGIIGYRALRMSDIEPGGRLGLFGFGASAHLAIQVALHWRCEVYAFTREEHHRALALELGASWAGAADGDPGVQLDSAVIFAPAGELVPLALARLRRGGTLAINAIHMSDIPSLPYDALYWERTLRSVANFNRRDAEEFLALASEIPVTASVERFRLDEANEALARIKQGRVHGAAVLVI
jgi:propanol-preferring alcohol dehydrogenase